MHLRDTASGSIPLTARARQGSLDQPGKEVGVEENTSCHGSALIEDSFNSLRFPAASRADKPGGTVRTPVAGADSVNPGTGDMDGTGILLVASQTDGDPSPCTPTKPCAATSPPRSAGRTSAWSDGVTPMSPAMTPTATSTTTIEQVRCKLDRFPLKCSCGICRLRCCKTWLYVKIGPSTLDDRCPQNIRTRPPDSTYSPEQHGAPSLGFLHYRNAAGRRCRLLRSWRRCTYIS